MAERFLSVTFRTDETVGVMNFLAGTTTSLPESIARGLGSAVTINGIGSAVLHNTASQQASSQAMVSGDWIPGRGQFVPPVALGWTPPVAVFCGAGGRIVTDYDPAMWRIATAATLWVSPTGNDITGNGSEATPYRGINKALQSMAGPTTIYVKAGVYDRRYGWQTTGAPAHDCNVIAVGGPVVSSTQWEGGTWTLTTNGTYRGTRSSVGRVIDEKFPDALGVAQELPLLASQAAVEASTTGAYYADGTNVWVRTADGRSPDSQVIVLLGLTNGNIQSDRRIFVSGVTFRGGLNGAFWNASSGLTADSRMVFDGCKFTYSQANGLSVLGVGFVLTSRCAAYGNADDGLNYHVGSNAIDPKFVELDCISFVNGLAADGTHNNNASTAHEACLGLRVSCYGVGCYGPTFADVGTSKTWNIGCAGGGSAATVGVDTQRFDFQAGESAVQWIDSCGAASGAYAGASATQYVRNSPGITGTAY